MNETQLIEKLKRIEALFAGAATEGERQAAALGRDRVAQRLEELRKVERPQEFKFSLGDEWSRRLFVALLRRYGFKPYRYARQRRATVMARVPKSFVDETLWPEYLELDQVLREYLEETTERVIRQGVYEDSSEAEVVKELT